MALQYVGGTSGVGTSTGYSVSLNGTLTGGIASSPAAGDIVVVFSGFGNKAASAPAISGNSSGAYSFVPGTTSYHQNDTYDTEFAAFYAVMGSTPDTSLTVTRVTDGAYGGATVVQVWRGQNTTNPFDVDATVAGAGNTGLINPPLITPVTEGAIILAGGAGTQTSAGSAFAVSSNMTGPSVSANGDGTTSDIGVCMASHAWTSGSFTPNAVTGGAVNTSCSWRAMTIALAPQPPAAYVLDAQPGTFALSGQAVTLLKTGVLDAQPGVLVITGQDATMTVAPALQNYELDAQPGAFSLGGAPAGLLKASVIQASPAGLSVSGASASLVRGRLLVAEPGALSLVGQDASLTVATPQIDLDAQPGGFTLAGAPAALLRSRVMAANAGVFSVTGAAATGPRSYVVNALHGAYSANGASATLLWSGAPPDNSGRRQTVWLKLMVNRRRRN